MKRRHLGESKDEHAVQSDATVFFVMQREFAKTDYETDEWNVNEYISRQISITSFPKSKWPNFYNLTLLHQPEMKTAALKPCQRTPCAVTVQP
jgi:hypothetical protein